MIESDNMLLNSRYADLLRSVKDAFTYTKIPDCTKSDIDAICKPRKMLKYSDCANDPTVFSYHILGIKPYSYQYLLFEFFRKRERNIVMISSRQLGKSLAIAILALWAATYNIMPDKVHNSTCVVIVSKSEPQAKRLISEIKKLIYLGDRKFAIRTGGRCTDVMSSKLADNQPQTATQITFTNGSSIISLPPTDSARGYPINVLIIDEFAFIPEEIYYDVLQPTTSKTGGITLMVSTPNGASGLGYKIFDPMNELKENSFKRLWIPWWYSEDENQRAEIEATKENWIAKGMLNHFQQEYEAKFTVSETNFFDSERVDLSVDNNLTNMMEYHSEPCSLGIDYGWKSCKTALSIVSKGQDGNVRLRFHYSYNTDGSDVNIVEDVVKLTERFNIKHIIPDDCHAGYLPNQKMINLGLPVTLYNFRTDQNNAERNRGYYLLRAGIYQNKVKIFKQPDLIKELKMLLEIKKEINTSIRAPEHEHDDLADSLCMACYPFLVEREDDDDLSINIYDEIREGIEELDGNDNDENKKHTMPRFDKDWERHFGGEIV